MVEVLGFENPDEMREFVQRNGPQSAFHPAQRAVTYNDNWVRFPNLPGGIVQFGWVATPDFIYQHRLDAGCTSEAARAMVATIQRGHENGHLWGLVYDREDRDGSWRNIYKADVWPCEESLFMAAAEVYWQIEQLPPSARVNLEIAFRALRSLKRSA